MLRQTDEGMPGMFRLLSGTERGSLAGPGKWEPHVRASWQSSPSPGTCETEVPGHGPRNITEHSLALWRCLSEHEPEELHACSKEKGEIWGGL